MTSQPLAFTSAIRQAGALCLTRGFLCTYGCTKSDVGNADGSSILPTSTTTGVPGFDGLLMADGQLVMVPAALGSAESRRPVRWAKFQTPTMTSTQSAKRPDVPAGRGVTNAGTLAGFGPLAPYFQRCDVAWPLGLGKRAETFPKKGSIPSHDANFNAGLLTTATLGRLKHEIGPTCHDANRRAQLAHSAGQGSTAQPGGRRPSQSPAFTSPRWSGALCLTRGFLYAPVPSVCRVCQSAKNPLDLGPVDSGCGPVPKRGADFSFIKTPFARSSARVNAERSSYRRGRQQTDDRGAVINGAWRGVLIALTFNGRNAQVDALEGNRCKTRPELRTEVTTTRSLTGTTPVTQEIDTCPSTFTAPPRTTTRMQTGNYGNGWRFFYAVSNAERTSHGRIERIANRSVRQTVVARKAAA